MAATVALVGLGRSGRKLFRHLYRRTDLRLACVVETADAGALEYLLRFDTQQGRFPEPIRLENGAFRVAGREIPLIGKPVEEISWKELGVDIVLEATARDLTRAALAKHLDAGAKRVVLCAPPVDDLDYVHVPGLTEGSLRATHRIVSNASATTHAAGALLEILDRAFGVERAMLNVVHALSKKQRLADVPSDDPRRGRAAGENIVPQESRSAALLAKLMPRFAGKLTGSAMNVPVTNGSAVDLVLWHKTSVSIPALNDAVKRAAAGSFWGIVDYCEDPIVSSDVTVTEAAATYDSKATMVLGERLSKTLTWFDAGSAYARSAVELAARLAALEENGPSAGIGTTGGAA